MSSVARDGRRRRLLHEGSGSMAAVEAAAANVGLRYAPAAGDASFAMAEGLVSRGWRGLTFLAAGLAGSIAVLAAIDSYGLALAKTQVPTPGSGAELLLADRPASLAAWFAASLWLVVAALAALVCGLRRQRMDDLRCTYRWWIVGSIAAVLLSANAATHAHVAFAGFIGKAINFSPLPGDALWWLVPGALVVGGLAVRLMIDLADCRQSFALMLAAFGVTSLGWLVEAGVAPSGARILGGVEVAPLVGPIAVLVGVALVVLAQVVLVRRIVLEARGDALSPAAKVAARAAAPTLPVEPVSSEPSTSSALQRGYARVLAIEEHAIEEPEAEERPVRLSARQRRAAERATETDDSKWVSGAHAEADEDYGDDDAPRRMSKADRKRLRRQRERDAA
jgi:hypothetical protein